MSHSRQHNHNSTIGWKRKEQKRTSGHPEHRLCAVFHQPVNQSEWSSVRKETFTNNMKTMVVWHFKNRGHVIVNVHGCKYKTNYWEAVTAVHWKWRAVGEGNWRQTGKLVLLLDCFQYGTIIFNLSSIFFFLLLPQIQNSALAKHLLSK